MTDMKEWRELQARWHQFGVFVPIFRAHGQYPHREIWNIDPDEGETYASILGSIRLRYRLMPYIYSLAAAAHFEDGTLMRGLPMDFPEDRAVAGLFDQWMFGPALMPCPVYEYGARSRSVYLPAGTDWYDFHDGTRLPGGRTLEADAPYDRIPVYVRAGSILPLGPDVQWSDERPADLIDLLVYPGADGSFRLYEDDGLTYGYERGEFATIEFRWDDAARTLTIGPRSGSFPGMLAERTFRITLVGTDSIQETSYDGSERSIEL